MSRWDANKDLIIDGKTITSSTRRIILMIVLCTPSKAIKYWGLKSDALSLLFKAQILGISTQVLLMELCISMTFWLVRQSLSYDPLLTLLINSTLISVKMTWSEMWVGILTNRTYHVHLSMEKWLFLNFTPMERANIRVWDRKRRNVRRKRRMRKK